MTNTSIRLVFLLGIWCVAAPAGEQPRTFAGYVQRLERLSACVSNSVDRTTVDLTPETARFYRLYEGDYLRCAPGASLRVNLRYGSPIDILGSNWYRVLLEPDPTPPGLSTGLVAAVVPGLELKKFARDRGAGQGAVFQPADGYNIRLGKEFEIAMIPRGPGVRLSVLLRTEQGEQLWSSDAGVGETVVRSAQAANALRAASAYYNGSFKLEYRLSLNGPWESLRFRLLPAAAEKKLASQLGSGWPQADKAEVHLARASLFLTNRLLNEAAQEYDAALRVSGCERSISLLECAKEIHQAIGNSPRVKAIEEQLKALHATK